MWRQASKLPAAKVLLTLFLSVGALAENPILITAPQAPHAHRAQTEAYYSAFHYEIADKANLNTRVQFLPIQSARASYERGNANAQLGAACGVERHTPSLYSVPYVLLTRHLITAGDSAAVTELESLRGKTLGVIKKYFYKLPSDATLSAMDITLHHSLDQLTLVKLLLSGRIDAMLESWEVAESLHQYIGHESTLHHVSNRPFSVRPLCYVVQDNEKGKLLISRLNKGIKAAFTAGILEKYTKPPFQVPSLEQIEGKITH